MSYSPISGTGAGAAPVVNLTFPLLSKDHLKASVNGSEVALTWTGPSQVTFNAPVASGAQWIVYRQTPIDPLLTFVDVTVLTAKDLNLLQNQLLYRHQELESRVDTVEDAAAAAESASEAAAIALDAAERAGAGRTRLLADRTYYVRTDGSDANTGLANTAGGAFRHIQHAIDVVYGLDLGGKVVTIQVGDGTYVENLKLYGPVVGSTAAAGQSIRLIGNEASPASVVVAPTAADYTLNLSGHGYLLMAGVKLTNGSGSGLLVAYGGVLEHRNCIFGSVTGEKILALHRGVVRALGPTSVEGDCSAFVHATKRSIVDFSAQTLTFVGSPVFSTYLWGINDASVDLDSATIVGTATGGIVVHDNGILNASSLTGSYLGGSTPEVNDGGIIAIKDRLELLTFYVRTDGNDANDGLMNSASRAFRTVQGAVNALSKLPYNPVAWAPNGGGLTIVLVGGPYNETVTLRQLHYPSGTIIGDEATPANVTINGVSHGFISQVRTPWFIRGVKITAAAGNGLNAEQGGNIIFRNVEFGSCSLAHAAALAQGRVAADGNYTVTGSGSFHLFARGNAMVDVADRTVTLTGTPAFSIATTYAELAGAVRLNGVTFAGAATGTRYSARTNGVIDTNGGGASFVPGNAAGSTSSGGQYV